MKNPSDWMHYLKHPTVLAGFGLLLLSGTVKALFVDNTTEWIQHLQHPIVLIGFALFVLSSLAKPLLNSHQRLSDSAIEHLLNKVLNFIFVIAFFAVLFGFILSVQKNLAASTSHKSAKPPQEINNYADINTQNNISGDINRLVATL